MYKINIMFSIKSKKTFIHAFTLVELVLVLGIIAVLSGLGFGGFIIFRNSTISGNVVEGAKTIIRDAQDKALTVSVDNDMNSSSFASETNSPWVYGYSVEYDQTAKQYILFKIVDSLGLIPSDKTNTQAIRSLYTTNNTPCISNSSTLTTFASCVETKRYSLEGNVTVNTCNIFFSSVNAIPTITSGSSSCYIIVDQLTSKMRLDFIKPSTQNDPTIGDIKICFDSGNVCK